jgi:hypothetical protein
VVKGTKSEKDRPQFKLMFELASRREFDLVLFLGIGSVLTRRHAADTPSPATSRRLWRVEVVHRAVPCLDGCVQRLRDIHYGDLSPSTRTLAAQSASRQDWPEPSATVRDSEGREFRMRKPVERRCGDAGKRANDRVQIKSLPCHQQLCGPASPSRMTWLAQIAS